MRQTYSYTKKHQGNAKSIGEAGEDSWVVEGQWKCNEQLNIYQIYKII